MYNSNSKNEVLENTTPVDKFEWLVLNDGTVKIDDYKGDDEEIVIPSEIDGKRVTVIGDNAFFDCKSLKSINIPDSVTEIGTRAFYGCKSLTLITVPDSVKVIKPFAFRECTSLTSIKLPDGAYKGVGVLMGTPLAPKGK